MWKIMGFNKWIHIDFFFYYMTADEQFAFENLVRTIVIYTRWIVRRKFYLYEPQPNCFLALEMRHAVFIPVIMLMCWFYQKTNPYIKQMGLHRTAGKDEKDEGNGEGFLNIMNAFTEWFLFTRFDSTTKISHIIHCAMEFQFRLRDIEIEFYKLMAKAYGIKRGNTTKKK